MLSLKQQYKWLQSQVSRQSQPYLLCNYLEKLNDNKKVVWQRSKKWFHLQRNYCLTTHWIQTKLWSNVVKFMDSDFKGKFYAPAFSISIGFPCKVIVFVKTPTQESPLYWLSLSLWTFSCHQWRMAAIWLILMFL